MSAKWFSLCYFGEFGIRSISYSIIDIFPHSHHLSVWYCIDIVRRNSVLVTHESQRVKSSFQLSVKVVFVLHPLNQSDRIPTPNVTLLQAVCVFLLNFLLDLCVISSFLYGRCDKCWSPFHNSCPQSLDLASSVFSIANNETWGEI